MSPNSLGKAQPDRRGTWRVRSSVRVVLFGLCLALLGGAACGGGGKGKGAQTPATPDGVSDPTGMNDGAGPTGDGTPTPGGDPTAPGGGGDTGAGAAGGDTGAGAGITPPNLDPDPAQSRAAVAEHIRIGKQALNLATLDPDLAIREARIALSIDGTNLDAAVIQAHAYYHKKLYDTAEVILDMLMKSRPTAAQHAGVNYVFGLIYDQTRQPERAHLAYKKAVELDANFVSAIINLGVHQLRNKQYAEAVAGYEKVVKLGGNSPEIWNALGAACRGRAADFDATSPERTEWLRRAETAFKKATATNRGYAPAYYNLGLLYLDADPYPAAAGAMDTLQRLQRAKGHFDEYKNMPGADAALYEERSKDVDKLIKREEKKRKKQAKEAAAPGG